MAGRARRFRIKRAKALSGCLPLPPARSLYASRDRDGRFRSLPRSWPPLFLSRPPPATFFSISSPPGAGKKHLCALLPAGRVKKDLSSARPRCGGRDELVAAFCARAPRSIRSISFRGETARRLSANLPAGVGGGRLKGVLSNLIMAVLSRGPGKIGPFGNYPQRRRNRPSDYLTKLKLYL